MMRKLFLAMALIAGSLLHAPCARAQEIGGIDFSNIDLSDIVGKVLTVKKGFAPKFTLGKNSIPKIPNVAKVLGLKSNPQIDKLFKTFRTGRTIYKVGAYVGTALTTYGTIKNIADNAKSQVSEAAKKANKTALISGLTTIASGLVVKFLTKAASYKAVDMFNGTVKKKLKDILSFHVNQSSIMGAPTMQAGFQIRL
jgi:hypothetical protein